jgi:hypothetical protein
MYYALAGQVSTAIELLQKAQQQAEETHGSFDGDIADDDE